MQLKGTNTSFRKQEPKELQRLKQESPASVGKVLVTVSLKGRATLPDERASKQWLLTSF